MLQVDRHAAKEMLADYVEQGQTLIARAHLIGDSSDYESWASARKQWIEATADGLRQIYDGPVEADEFRSAADMLAGGARWQVEYRRESTCVQEAIDVLTAIEGRLELAPDAGAPVAQESGGSELAPGSPVASTFAPAAPSPGLELAQEPVGAALVQDSVSAPVPSIPAGMSANGTGRVFLVHGRNEKWKQAVIDLLGRAGAYDVTILNERPNDRRALVEQFGEHPAEARYAVVLLTADDVGAPRVDSGQEPYFSSRARQAVVFEMGVLMAALSPYCMCVLYEDGVELPCDLTGVAYVRLDLADTWKLKLLLHLRSAGFEYDLNRLAPF